MDSNGWIEWKQHVLAELKRQSSQHDGLEDSIKKAILEIKIDIATLKVKASIWGAMGGLVAFLASAAIELLRR